MICPEMLPSGVPLSAMELDLDLTLSPISFKDKLDIDIAALMSSVMDLMVL